MTLKQRERYRNAARDLVLPAFVIKDGREWRPVQYETDILSRVPWNEVDVSPLFELQLGRGTPGDVELRAGLDGEPLLDDPEATAARTPTPGKGLPPRESPGGEIDYYFAASHLLDAIPEPSTRRWESRPTARTAASIC